MLSYEASLKEFINLKASLIYLLDLDLNQVFHPNFFRQGDTDLRLLTCMNLAMNYSHVYFPSFSLVLNKTSPYFIYVLYYLKRMFKR